MILEIENCGLVRLHKAGDRRRRGEGTEARKKKRRISFVIEIQFVDGRLSYGWRQPETETGFDCRLALTPLRLQWYQQIRHHSEEHSREQAQVGISEQTES